MEKEFVSYEQAVALKELGFNEKCLSCYLYEVKTFTWELNYVISNNDVQWVISAPLKQQVFRWFREKYSGVLVKDYGLIPHFTIIQNMFLDSHKILIYEEAEDDCIDKLIELAKQQS